MIQKESMPPRPQHEIGTTPFHTYTFDDGSVWTEFFRLGDAYLLRFPGLADFEISADGMDVIAHPVEEIDAATVEHLFINQVLPLALSRQGRPAFHASVVEVGGVAAAFLGKAGSGKSTLAASFALSDAAFLTDDALLVEETSKGCFAAPSHPSLRLWEDSVAALIDAGNPRANAVSYSSKERLLAGTALTHRNAPRELAAAYLLQDDGVGDTKISQLKGSQRQIAWINNSFLLDIEDQDLLADHFEWTHRISSRIPTFGLDYPRDYGMLPVVRRTIRKHIADICSKDDA